MFNELTAQVSMSYSYICFLNQCSRSTKTI